MLTVRDDHSKTDPLRYWSCLFNLIIKFYFSQNRQTFYKSASGKTRFLVYAIWIVFHQMATKFYTIYIIKNYMPRVLYIVSTKKISVYVRTFLTKSYIIIYNTQPYDYFFDCEKLWEIIMNVKPTDLYHVKN